MTLAYADFLKSKIIAAEPVGFEPKEPLNSKMFPFQKDICLWALRRGRAALFEDCGTGKSIQELEWSKHVSKHTDGNVLILTPIAVSQQMAREAAKFGIEAKVCKTSKDLIKGINITNYEKLHHFRSEDFKGIVLDESSILKSFEGSTRKQITEFAKPIHYRLAATATPSPNSLIELTNHAEFLDIMRGKEIIALFFTQDGNSAQKFKLKGHAKVAYWKWLASWAVALRKPSDLGYSDDGFILPPLRIHPIIVESKPLPGYLFVSEASGLAENRAARRNSIDDRVAKCAEIANSTKEPFAVWCDLNDESSALAKAIPGSVEIRGSDSEDKREKSITGFVDGSIRVIISKPSITGHGMNFQHCCKTAFVGLSFSWEMYYQAHRRFWRFGQKNTVDSYVITSEAEGQVVESIHKKEAQASAMFDGIIEQMKGLSIGKSIRDNLDYSPSKTIEIPNWVTEYAKR